MLIGRARTPDGPELLIFALTEADVEQVRDGQPIIQTGEVCGLPGKLICVTVGADDKAVTKKAAGMVADIQAGRAKIVAWDQAENNDPETA